MRLVVYANERLSLVPMSSARTYSADEVINIINSLLAGTDQLSLDFSGEYIPICIHEEVAIVASLVAAYHNSLVRSNIEVSHI